MRYKLIAILVGVLAFLSLASITPVHARTIVEKEVNDSAGPENQTFSGSNLFLVTTPIVALVLPQTPGSVGTYRIEIPEFNGDTIHGTAAVPEPDTIGFAFLSLIPLAAVANRWRHRR